MIDRKDVDAYMSIKAPDSLKERLMSEQAKKNDRISSTVRMCYALAAAVLVIIAVFAFFPEGGADIYYNDVALDKQAVIIKTAENANARIALLSTRDLTDIPLSVETDKKTVISVSHGSLTVVGKDTSENVGHSYEASSDVHLIWSVELDSDTGDCTLTVGKDSYCISENSKAQWVLSKK